MAENHMQRIICSCDRQFKHTTAQVVRVLPAGIVLNISDVGVFFHLAHFSFQYSLNNRRCREVCLWIDCSVLVIFFLRRIEYAHHYTF